MSKPNPPFSLRLSAEERQRLEAMAGRQPVGAFIRDRLFGQQANLPRQRHARSTIKDDKSLSQVLARLGQSRLSSNINQLARAANSGSLPVTPETESALVSASRDIAAIKALLMKALGIRER